MKKMVSLFGCLVILTIGLAPSALAGIINKALALDGDGDYVEVSDDPSLNFGSSTDFSIEFWIKAPVQDSELIGKAGGEVPSTVGWNVQCENTPEYGIGVRLDMYDGSSGHYNIVTTGEEALDNNWRHVAFSVDRDGYAKVFLDGVWKDSEDVSSIGNINNNKDLLIGWRGDWFYYFNGLIDEVRIWKVARTQGQIKRWMNRRIWWHPEGLVGYWRMDDPLKSRTAKDYSGNGNDGTLMGDAHFVFVPKAQAAPSTRSTNFPKIAMTWGHLKAKQ